MLCGLYPPSSGTASIMGFDLRHEIDEIHSIIGYCPQHDILYDSLNVEEHLILVSKVNEIFLKNFILLLSIIVYSKIKSLKDKRISERRNTRRSIADCSFCRLRQRS